VPLGVVAPAWPHHLLQKADCGAPGAHTLTLALLLSEHAFVNKKRRKKIRCIYLKLNPSKNAIYCNVTVHLRVKFIHTSASKLKCPSCEERFHFI
jgi:hypothetical protein